MRELERADGWRLGRRATGVNSIVYARGARVGGRSVCATFATEGAACNGRGACVDVEGDYPNYACACEDGYLGTRCEAEAIDLPIGEHLAFDGAMSAGQYEVFRFDVRCKPMDVEITFRKTSQGASGDCELQFLLHRSQMPHVGQLGIYTNESTVRAMYPGEDGVNIDINDIEPGMWYLQLIVITGSLKEFEIGYELFGSRLARFYEYNGCERDDGALTFSVYIEGGASPMYTRTQPFVFEPDYRDCGDEYQSCYLGDAHSSIRGQGRGAARKGVGPIRAKPVLAMSAPMLFDKPYFLLVGDSRKFVGVYNESKEWFTTDGLTNATLTSYPPRLLAQMIPNQTALPFDHEGCGNMYNGADMRGNVCVVARGSCFFSQKTLECQANGAVAAIIIDDEFDAPFAPDNWVSTNSPEEITIPTLAYNLADGNRLLEEMFEYPNVTVHMRTYECEPKIFCAECAPGLTSPETNCTSDNKCPGMDESFSTNCTGHGECARDANETLACACDDEWTGDACDISKSQIYDADGATQIDENITVIEEPSHHFYHHASRGTTIVVLSIVFSLFAVAVCVAGYQIHRRRRRMTAHIIWKPEECDEDLPPPTVVSRV